jgi:hypothetical protein
MTSDPNRPNKSENKKPSVTAIRACLGIAFVVAIVVYAAFPDAVGQYLHDVSPGVATFATLVIAFFTYTLWVSTDAMQQTTTDTLNHLRGELEADQRPWIVVTPEITLPWNAGDQEAGMGTPLPGGRYLGLDLRLQNIGKSPAINVKTYAEMFLVLNYEDVAVRQREIYESEKRSPTSPDDAGFTVFHGEEVHDPRGLYIDQAKRVAFEALYKEAYPTQWFAVRTSPAIVVAVTYRFHWNHELHQSCFVYQLCWQKPGTPKGYCDMLDMGKTDTIPADQLWLIKYPRLTPIID